MAQLSSVIGSILRDIISAQHEANLYSISMSESYGKDGKAKDFQLPNVVLSDMELELKYAVVGASDNEEQYNISYSRFRKFINNLCGEAASTVITSVVHHVGRFGHSHLDHTARGGRQAFLLPPAAGGGLAKAFPLVPLPEHAQGVCQQPL